MHKGHSAWWNDAKIYRSKDVFHWRVQPNVGACLQRVDLLVRKCSPCEKSEAGRHMTRRLFRFRQREEETWDGHCTRTSRLARKCWKHTEITFLTESIAERMKSLRNVFLGDVHVGGKMQALKHGGGGRDCGLDRLKENMYQQTGHERLRDHHLDNL